MRALGRQSLVLKVSAGTIFNRNSQSALEANRQIVLDNLLDDDKRYILEVWLPKERRAVQLYTQFNTNFGYFSTQRIESLNRTMHKIVNHQTSLEQAAQEIVTWTRGFYRDYENDLHKSRTERSIAIDQNYFSSLSGSVTLKAIELVSEQWVRLAIELPECIGQSRKQYQLPCVHDLLPAYLEGRPLPRSLLHPRWWIAAHIPTRRGWQPGYELAFPTMTGTGRLTIQAQFQQSQDIREKLRVDLQRRFDQRIATEPAILLQEGQRLQQASTRSLQLPANVQRFQPKIPIRDQQLVMQANREQRQLAREATDTRALVLLHASLIAARQIKQTRPPSG